MWDKCGAKMSKIAKSMLDCVSLMSLGTTAKCWTHTLNIKGKMLEIGGTGKTNSKQMSSLWGLKYHNMNLEKNRQPDTIIGDICDCKKLIPDNTYDFVYSMDTFEHIKEPWKAANEIVRILKPNGMVFIATLFSWRYHPAPIDYWRYSPHCLAFLFKKLECMEANWDSRQRRQNHKGGTIEGLTDKVPLDNMGGFRENWRVYYVGRKNV